MTTVKGGGFIRLTKREEEKEAIEYSASMISHIGLKIK